MVRESSPRNDPLVTPMRRLQAHPRTLVDAAAEEIRQRIASGTITPGQRLPSEQAFSQELGVSRTVLREALSSLEALGIIETRTTRGRYVADASGSPARSQSLVRAWLHHRAAEIADFDEIRAMIEAHVIRNMTEAETFEAARRIRMVVFDQRAAVERGDTVQAAESDADFHRILYSFTRNGTLLAFASAVSEQMWQATLAVYSLPESASRSVAQHEAITEALASGDRERAAELDTEHQLESAGRHSVELATEPNSVDATLTTAPQDGDATPS